MAESKESGAYPFWLIAGISAITLFSCVSAVQSYGSTVEYARENQDPYMINAQPDRLRGAAAYLPADAEVGYLSDLSFDAPQGSAAYFGVMYELAPRLVTRSADLDEWVVGNFSHPMDFAAAGNAHGLEMVKEFGNGIVVFRRRRK